MARSVLPGEICSSLSEAEMRAIRGNEISMIFQEPMTSLNPVLTVGSQIAETLILHQGLSRSAAREQGGRDAAARAHSRGRAPRRRISAFQLSGGMRQRVDDRDGAVCNPKAAASPTSRRRRSTSPSRPRSCTSCSTCRSELGTAIVLITHDLGVIAETAQRVVVMYAGRKVEEAPVEALFERPRHPYTLGLMKSVPRIDKAAFDRRSAPALPRSPAWCRLLRTMPAGCIFAPRCAFAVARCHASIRRSRNTPRDIGQRAGNMRGSRVVGGA